MGRLAPWKENSVVGRDATMAGKETGDVVVDSGHTCRSRRRHGFVTSESVSLGSGSLVKTSQPELNGEM